MKISITEAADILNITRQGLYWRIENNVRCPNIYVELGRVCFDKEEVEDQAKREKAAKVKRHADRTKVSKRRKRKAA